MVTNNSVNNTSKTTTFTSSGTFTKDSRTKYAFVIGIGGGGGGGSGRRGAAGTDRTGGGGGSSQGSFFYQIPGSVLGTSETVTIGSLGNGGGNVATDDTNGNNGQGGGATSFGNIKTYSGAVSGGGIGGTTTTAAGGAASQVITNLGIFTGAAGGAGIPNGAGNGQHTPINGVCQCLGGGAAGSGGGIDSADNGYSGGTGGNVRTWGSSPSAIQVGGIGGTFNSNNSGSGKAYSLTTSGGVFVPSTGGGGSGSRATAGSLIGGAGGANGGSGGGGGAVINGIASTTEGRFGTTGLVIITEFF